MWLLRLFPRLAFALTLVAACSSSGSDEFLLGATTSVQDSGLLDELVNTFEGESGYQVKPIVQGSGQILELAKNGELDLAITHSPADEQELVDQGFGESRTPFMQNYFQIVGPPADPAGVGSTTRVADALKLIADSGSPFISRGDESGTHIRELSYWTEAGIDPVGQSWYTESGTGQGQTLSIANDRQGYTLIDSSTFTSQEDSVELVLLVRDADHPNIYSVVVLNAERFSGINEEAATAWAEFVTGPDGQAIIGDFGRNEYGEALFEPLLLN